MHLAQWADPMAWGDGSTSVTRRSRSGNVCGSGNPKADRRDLVDRRSGGFACAGLRYRDRSRQASPQPRALGVSDGGTEAVKVDTRSARPRKPAEGCYGELARCRKPPARHMIVYVTHARRCGGTRRCRPRRYRSRPARPAAARPLRANSSPIAVLEQHDKRPWHVSQALACVLQCDVQPFVQLSAHRVRPSNPLLSARRRARGPPPA
jgi:hypothetical protein